MTIKDLSLLNQEDIKIKFSEDMAFSIPTDPSLDFTYKLMDFEQKSNVAKSNKEQFDLLVDMVALILGQDEENKITKDFIKKKFSLSQVQAVVQIYMEQIAENQNNPN